jgi:hypothetical protein
MNQARMATLRSFSALTTITLLVGGCVSLSSDGRFGAVSSVATDRLGKDARIIRNDGDERARLIEDKLRAPLTANDAVQIALLNNRAFRPIGTWALPKPSWRRPDDCKNPPLRSSVPVRERTSISSVL